MVLNWSHLNLRCHNFGFGSSNTFVVVDLFVAVVTVAVVVPVFVALVKDIQG